jgi:hypothetical protein
VRIGGWRGKAREGKEGREGRGGQVEAWMRKGREERGRSEGGGKVEGHVSVEGPFLGTEEGLGDHVEGSTEGHEFWERRAKEAMEACSAWPWAIQNSREGEEEGRGRVVGE